MKRWLLLGVMVLATAAPAAAQGWIEPFPGRRDPGVNKLRTAVSVRVDGRVARVEVEEWFRNDGGGLGEGDYLYPLPGEAVFNNFSLFQGDQELRGETMDAEQARAIYEEIVRRKRDPALIELAGKGLLRSRVFPIQPGETRKITLRYTQVLGRAGDALQFRYAAGVRHQGGIAVRPTVPRGELTVQHAREDVPLSFTLVLEDASAFGDPFSPTHEVSVQRRGKRVTVRPEDELSGDFTLFLPLTGGLVGVTGITHRPASDPGFFMITLSPGEAEGETVARDITAVVDVSGSMSGEKMEQARAALHSLLSTLSRRDRFRLIAFSNQVRSYRPEWTIATPNAIATAQDWVERLHAEGGTNISGALSEAFKAESPETRLPFVVFITDGLPSVGEQNPERIAERVERTRGRARIFAFGVGYDVNTYLLDRLSAAARGSTQYVQPNENVEQAISTLATKIQRPVLTDLRIADSPVELEEVYPEQLPDLFAGEELVIMGRYDGSARGNIVITGVRNGRRETFRTALDFPRHDADNEFMPKLWAARKVGALSQRLRLNGHDAETLQELRETALRYGVLSEYTSYLVQEPMQGNVAGGRRLQEAVIAGAAAPPPAAATGQAAVQSAERQRLAREARTEADVDMAMKDIARDAAASGRRLVAGRSFVNRNGVWIDALHREGQSVVTVAPFSNGYFKLLRVLPELEPFWKALPQVLVSGKRVSIKVGAGGVEQLSASELVSLVQRFRN